MTGEKHAVLDFIQNLAVELKKVSDKNRKRREDIRNNPDMPIREQISASGEWQGIADMNAAFMDYAESLGFSEQTIWAKINGGKNGD